MWGLIKVKFIIQYWFYHPFNITFIFRSLINTGFYLITKWNEELLKFPGKLSHHTNTWNLSNRKTVSINFRNGHNSAFWVSTNFPNIKCHKNINHYIIYSPVKSSCHSVLYIKQIVCDHTTLNDPTLQEICYHFFFN